MSVRWFEALVMCLSLLIATAGCTHESRSKGVNDELASSQIDDTIDVGPAIRQIETPTMSEIWRLRRDGKHKEVIRLIDELMASEELDYDTKGLCLFLQGDSYRRIGDFAKAREYLDRVIYEYPMAKYKDERYGEIDVKPECDVAILLVVERDACPFPESSQDYTALGWTYLGRRKLSTAIAMAEACIVRFQSSAIKQQSDHGRAYGKGWPDLKPDPNENTDILERYWALYDVGTCFFILGQAYERQADMARENQRLLYEKAISCYDEVIRKYAGAQCFDPRGPWYWRVKEGVERQINLINMRISRTR